MPKENFQGLRVLALESRRAAEIEKLITTFGGTPTVAPALREIPLSSNTQAIAFGQALVAGEFDAVVFLTGVGARALMAVIEAQQPRDVFLSALSRTRVIARGPKPVAVLREWRTPVWVTAPEPNTWRELLAAIDVRMTELPFPARIAVQEYGISNTELIDGLRTRGFAVTQVPVYQWALPEDVEPMKRAARAVAAREIDVVLLTTQIQLVHLVEVASSIGLEREVLAGLARAVIASIGPTTSDEIRRRGLPVDLEASHPKMGVLVTEAAEHGTRLLAAKRRS